MTEEDYESGVSMIEHSVPKSALSKCADGSNCVKVEALYVDSPEPIPVDTPESTAFDIFRKLCAEALGTCILLTVIVGSGIMAETLSPTDVGLQLLENATSVGLALIGLILIFGPVSGAHFNPIVSFLDCLHGDMSVMDVVMYTIAQVSGGICGTLLSNWQFDKAVDLSEKARDDNHQYVSEVIASVTLLLLIHGCLRTNQKSAIPFAVGGWVTSGHFFTSSTIFANPAVTIARQFSNTFTGIKPSSVAPFIGCQVLGALISYVLIRLFFPKHIEMKKDDNLYLRCCIHHIDERKLKID